jgi:hypothetical protein
MVWGNRETVPDSILLSVDSHPEIISVQKSCWGNRPDVPKARFWPSSGWPTILELRCISTNASFNQSEKPKYNLTL